MMECLSVSNKKVTTSWIVDDDYIYKGGVYLCPSVSNEKVTTSWIFGDDDIYI